MKLSKLRTDPKREVEGVWEDCGDGLRLKIGRMGNPKYEAALLEARKKSARGALADTDLDALRPLMIDAMSRYIVIDWEGLEDDDGTPIPYSVEKAKELLTNTRDFFAMVFEISNDRKLYREANLVEDEGN